MYSKLIEYTGNGDYQEFDLNFDPSNVFIVPKQAGAIGYHNPGMWVARTNFFGAADTVGNGVRLLGRRLMVGNHASVNTLGNQYTALVLGAEDGDLQSTSYMGNATAGREIKLQRPGVPLFVSVKRDNSMPPVVRSPGYPCRAADATAVGAEAVVINDGTLTVSAENYVNQYDGTATLGEGIDVMAVYAGGGAQWGWFTGNANPRTIPVGAGKVAVLMWRTSGTTTVGLFLRGGDGSVKTSNLNAPSVNIGTLTDAGLALNGAGLNENSSIYNWLALPLNDPAEPLPQAPALNLSGKKALRFEGRGVPGSVNFGTGLNIADEITLEWFGWTPGEAASPDTWNSFLIGKVGGAYNTAGAASWGLSSVNRITEFAHNWAGPQMTAIVSRRMAYPGPINVSSWRTGVVVPYGMHLWQYVRRLDGSTELWRDGVRVKQRMIATDSLTADGVTHRVSMGSWWNGSAWTHPSRMAIASCRVYSRGLTDAEMLTRAEKVLYGSAAADITSGLAANWDASNISGTTWADSAGSNTGTIVGGTLIDL